MQVASETMIRPAGKPGDWGWITMAHGEIYHAQFDWSAEIELSTAQLLVSFNSSHNPKREECWIAETNGERVGCIMCVASEESADAARLRLLLVHPSGRGTGVGTALVTHCIEFAREAGYAKITLRTYDVLKGARTLYRTFGFERTGMEAMHIFGRDLVEETWKLNL